MLPEGFGLRLESGLLEGLLVTGLLDGLLVTGFLEGLLVTGGLLDFIVYTLGSEPDTCNMLHISGFKA